MHDARFFFEALIYAGFRLLDLGTDWLVSL